MKKESSAVTVTTEDTDVVDHICPSCLSKGMRVFHKLHDVPVHSVLNILTKEEALSFPRGDISLGFCQGCGFISNMDFDPDLLRYSSACEESQGFSPTFNEFARSTAEDLIGKYDLHGKDIIEIGCGKGEFLSLLCELGENRGVGFDPAYVPGRSQGKSPDRITFIQDFYSEKYASYDGDLVCCRMTLEHISDPAVFVSMVRRSIGERLDTIVFFQVPDVTRILRECAFEDIYYEHCSYFSPGSLRRLFEKCAFEVVDLRTEYAGQYLMLEAKPAPGTMRNTSLPADDLATITNYLGQFQNNYKNMVNFWRREVKEIQAEGKKAVLWGSGSKGVSFLTTLNIRDEIEYVVDINRFRQGAFMAGTGQLIVAPGFLRNYKPDIVIIMNSIYQNEIQNDLSQMGLAPRIMTLGT